MFQAKLGKLERGGEEHTFKVHELGDLISAEGIIDSYKLVDSMER